MNDTKKKIVELDLNDVLPNRFQPRIKFTEESIIELSESIKTHGLLQPIIVRPIGDKYEIIAGERRYKACVIAGLDTISSIIIDYNDKDSAEVALIENVQRRDLTAIEEAISYKKILDMGYLTQEQLATKLGKSQSSIANKIRLLNLCDEVQEALMEEKISERHARSLLKLKSTSEQRYMLKKIIKERLTVRKADTEIQKLLDGEIIVDEIEDNNSKEEVSEVINKSQDIEKEEVKIEQKEESDDLNSFESEVTDITNLFDEAKLEEFLNKISLSGKEIIKNEENEKEENDKMINDPSFNNNQVQSSGRFFNMPTEGNVTEASSIFGLNNNEQAISTNNIDELLTPQGNNSPSNINNRNSGDSITTIEQKNSMFSSLLNSSSENSQDDVVDKETFGKFLDPTYVDGAKREDSNSIDSSVDNSVFAKFLDPDYGGKTEIKENSISNDFNSIFNTPVEKEVEDKNVELPTANNFNSIFNAPGETNIKQKEEVVSSTNDFNSIFTIPTENKKNDNEIMPKTIDLLQSESSSNNQFNPEEQLAIFNSNNQNKAPDLLAPMGSIKEDEVPNIFEQPSFKEDTANSIFTSDNLTLDNTIFSDSVSNMQESRQEISEPIQVQNEIVQSELKQPEEDQQDSVKLDVLEQAPTQLEPIKTITEDQVPVKDEMIQQTSTVSVPESSIFVTASTSSQSNLMPETPIIDNPDISKLLSVNPVQSSVESVPEDVESPSTISETITSEPEIQIPGPIGNQPIIVTDYNKQYDPILPDSVLNKESQVDLRQIINMIRELNNKIESYGYVIDTEEIDLVDSYQVIFNIEKK